jgi:O-antigen/teichoic acid export membrane protein
MGYAGITLGGAAIGGLLAMVDEVLIARFMGPSTYGLYAIGFMLARIGSIIAAFGLPVTILHFLPVHLTRGEMKQALGSIVGAVLMPLIAGGLFALGLRALSGWFAVSVFNDPGAAVYIDTLALLAPLIALTEVLGHIARAFGHALHYVIIRNLAPPIVYLLAILGVSHLGGPHIAIAYSLIGAYICGALLGLIFVGQFALAVIGPIRPQLELRALYAYAFPVLLNASVSLGLLWTDLFQLGIFTNAVTVGIYRACMQVVVAFDVIGATFSAAVGPIYPVLIAQRRHDQLRNTYLAAVHLATLLATPLFLLVLCNSDDLLAMLGPRFTAGAVALSILAFGHFLKVCLGTAAVLLVLGGRQRLEAGNATVAAALNIMLNYLLIPRLGLVGAATSTCTSLIVLSALRLIQVSRAFPVTTLDPAIFRVVLVTLPLAVVSSSAFAFAGFGQGTGIPHLIARLIMLTVMISLAIWFVCLSKSERAMLGGLLTRRNVEATPDSTE